jgi:transglutaminase-like putative cysteine protease
MTPARPLAGARARLGRNPEVVLLVILAALAVAPFGRLYADHRYLVLAAGAGSMAAAVSLLVSPRLPLPAAVGAAGVGAFAYMGLFVFHTFRPTSIWDGVTQSWTTLLTASLPAVSTSTDVALPVVLTFAATFLATELAVRSRWKAGPVLAPLGVLVVGLLFTGKRPLPSLALIAAISLLALLTVSVRVHASAPFGLPRLVPIAVAATALGAVLPITSSSHRVDLRARYNPPVQISPGITPLALLQSELNSQSNTPLFTVRFRDVPPGTKIDRVPIATLNTYDGAVWGTNDTFARAGNELPAGPAPPQSGPIVRQDFQLGAYGLPFLPALGRPIRATGRELAFDRASGMLATPTPAGPGYRYGVESEVPDQSRVASEPVKPGDDPNFATLALAPPQGWPPAITNFANRFSAKTPYATLQLIANELRSRDFGYNKKARPGHSLGLLSAFLTAPSGSAQVTTARVGFAEQFAAAFAVLARVKGFPSVVVVGYRVDPVAAARGEPIVVLPREIHAWAEVNLNGVGWVTFDPTNTTPRDSTVLSAPPPGTTAAGRPGRDGRPRPGQSCRLVARRPPGQQPLLVGVSLDRGAHGLAGGRRRGQNAASPAAGSGWHHDRAGRGGLAGRAGRSPVARGQGLGGDDGRGRRPGSPEGDWRRRRHAGPGLCARAERGPVCPLRTR